MARMLPALTLAFALAAAACTSKPPHEASDDARAPLRALLRQRAALLLAGDVEGFLRPLSPSARLAEEPIARGAMAVPLAGLDVVVGDADTGVPGRLDNAQVDFIFRYKGLPEDNTFRFRRRYRVEQQAGAPVVVESAADPEFPLPVWATGPLEVTRSPHFLALSRPGLSNVARLLEVAEQARARLTPKLTIEPDPVHLLLLASGDAQYAELSGAPEDDPSDDSVSLALARAYYAGRGPEAREMVANVDAIFADAGISFEGRASVNPVEVFQHELAHLAVLRFNGSETPGWVAEGAAMFLSGERRVDEWQEALRTGFSELSFVTLSEQEDLEAYAYGYANAAALYLVEEFGADTFWEFYRGIRRSDTARMLRLVYKMDAAELDSRVREWMRREAA
ncbi:MAG: hypothetical protein M3P85_00070 [Actinomycetota bacterium]|nr:hypothetical protein [Actinomycetota bacterium]